MRKLSRRETTLVASLLILIVIYVGLNHWYIPMIDRVNALKQEKEQLTGKWEQIKQYKETKVDIQAELDQINAGINRKKQSLLSDKSTYLFWQELLDRANKAGVKVSLLQEGDKDKQADVRTAQLRVTGVYPAVTRFMESLEPFPYVYAITEGDIQSRGQLTKASFSLLIGSNYNLNQ